jgi:hypothetical protein
MRLKEDLYLLGGNILKRTATDKYPAIKLQCNKHGFNYCY